MSHPEVEECPRETGAATKGEVNLTSAVSSPPDQKLIVARDCAGQNPGMYSQHEASPFIKGVVNLRGLVVPVFDLKVRFDQNEAHHKSLNLNMVTDHAGRVVGAVPDEAGAVIELQGVAISALPGVSGDTLDGPITGIGLVERADKPGTLILAYIRQKAPGSAPTAAA